MNHKIHLSVALFGAGMATLLAATIIYAARVAMLPQPVVIQGAVHTRSGPADIYPPVPGAINTAITQANISQNICNPKWSTKSERPASAYTTSLKIKQFAQFHYTDTKTGDFEEDHLLSLELGGNPTDPNNLWPESYRSSLPGIGAKTKDLVENYLHAQVCAGTLTLAQAQHEIVSDWYAVYLAHVSARYGSVNSLDADDQ